MNIFSYPKRSFIFLLVLWSGQLLAAPAAANDAVPCVTDTIGVIVSAGNSGIITCTHPSITLSATTSATGATNWSWTGPGNFTSSSQNPVVNIAGAYRVTATNNGLTGSAAISVVLDTISPINVSAYFLPPTNKLTCLYNFAILQGQADLMVSGRPHYDTFRLTYRWTGPGNFTSGSSNILAYNPGVYAFTAIDLNNGCPSSPIPLTVLQDIAPPNLVAQPALSQLTCIKTAATITTGGSTPGLTYTWSGPGNFASSDSSITVAAPGNYTVFAVNPVNQCTSTTSVQVSQNVTPPANLSATTLSGFNEITCTYPTQILSASPKGFYQFSWTGPNGYSSSGEQVSVGSAGSYTFVATNPANGCQASSIITLVQNNNPPGASIVSVPASGIITCKNFSIALSAATAAPSVIYNWSGPNNFASSQKNVTANYAGNYTVMVTDLTNGCKSTATDTITQQLFIPLDVSAFVSSQLTCSVTDVALTGSSSTPGVTYSWFGPNGFTAAAANTHTGSPGRYFFVVTDPATACVKAIPVTVSQNIAPPANTTAANSGPLTCTVTEVTLTGSSSSPNVEYQWDGPDGYLSFSAEDIATEPGRYVLTVTNDDNGCIIKDTTIVALECGARRAISSAAGTGTAPTFEWKVYPNPVSDKAFVTFKLPEAAFVTVQVYNSNGIAEKILFSNKAAANQLYTFTLTGNLPAGIHYFTIRVNNKIYTKKIIVAK